MEEAPRTRRKKGHRRTRLKPRLTPQAKSHTVDLIIRDFVAGLTVKAIAEKHRISTASVYRWQRQRDEFQRAINAEAITSQLNIDDALKILCSGTQNQNTQKLEALFRFLVWIRWPASPGLHTAAIINCTASYLKQKYQVNLIRQLPDSEAEVLLCYLTLDVAARFSSPNAAFNPDFEIVTDRKSRYDDRQFFADVISYLLSPIASVSRRPTLDRLQSLVEMGAFGPGWSMSPRTFEKHWRARAASFPFLYVEQYHSHFDWSLNPSDPDFMQSVDEIMASLDGMRTYLGRVKGVIAELEISLDARAVSRINFPKIPHEIETVRTQPPALKPRMLEKISQLK